MPTRGGRLRTHATIRRAKIPIDVQGNSPGPKPCPGLARGLKRKNAFPTSPAAICARPPVQAGRSPASACRFAP